MATDPIKKTYIHTAHGYGFSARIDRPFEHLVDVHAGSTLPTTGGFEVSRAENFLSRKSFLTRRLTRWWAPTGTRRMTLITPP